MARIVIPLNDTKIRNAKYKSKNYSMNDGQGLSLFITKNSKIWRFDYYKPITNKRTLISIGNYPEISLQQARIIKEEYRSLLANNIDPQEHNKHKIETLKIHLENTFASVAANWKKKKLSSIKEITMQKDWERLEKHILPHLKNKPVSEIKLKELVDLLTPLQDCGKLDTLKRVTSLTNQILDYAVDTGLIEHNPCIRARKAFTPPRKQHLATISYQELPEFFSSLSSSNISFVVRSLILWQLLTMVRPSEAVSAKWEEIDFENKIWTIPAEKMKGKKGHTNYHIVPLAEQAIKVLHELRPFSAYSEYVFAHRTKQKTHMNSQTANMAIKRVGFKDRLTAHGLRALASTTLNEKSTEFNFNPDAIEACLAHKISNEVRKAYNRSTYIDERTKIMQWWADFVFQFIQQP